MIELSKFFIVVYIDHNIIFDIAKQISLTITFIDKLNLRLVRAFDYLQRFNFDFYYKLNKQHIVLNVLFKLTSTNIFKNNSFIDDELDTPFIAFLVKMKLNFCI